MHRPTPCVGICSTTYGDLVCRGCKRFAHEIVEWNGYDESQRAVVGRRLMELREGAVNTILTDKQLAVLSDRAAQMRVIGAGDMSAATRAYETLRCLARYSAHPALPDSGRADTPRILLERVDREFYARSLAVFERSFKVPVQ